MAVEVVVGLVPYCSDSHLVHRDPGPQSTCQTVLLALFEQNMKTLWSRGIDWLMQNIYYFYYYVLMFGGRTIFTIFI